MPRIMVVEDDDLVRGMLRQMMAREGYEVAARCNGREALQYFEQDRPNLVVTDLIMPEGEGIELIRQLRKKHPALKIVAISGGSRFITPDSQLTTAAHLGADLTFAKPLDRATFLGGIRKLLERRHG